MRIDAPIITGSFSLNGDTFQDLGAYTTTGSNTFIGNQIIEGTISASELSGSIDYTNLRNVPTLVSGSSQIVNILSSLNTYTGSNDTINTNQNNRLGSLENKTGSLATTGSNSFFGTQTFSGSVFIANDLVVQGSSSIQYISASSVSIGTNIVQLNTATPSVRYAGLSVQDSGSSAGVTGSMLWDSLCNRWIYSNPSGVGYSGGMLLSGPRTQTLGTEPTLTCNYIAKSGGGDHLYDSCIVDNGTTVCVNATLKASGQVCGVMGTFSCIGIGTTTPIIPLDICGSDVYGSSQMVISNAGNTSRLYLGTGGGAGSIFYGGRYTIDGLVQDSANAISQIGMSVGDQFSGGSSITFSTALCSGVDPIIRMKISGEGNVGIGSAFSPYAKLVVTKGVQCGCIGKVSDTAIQIDGDGYGVGTYSAQLGFGYPNYGMTYNPVVIAYLPQSGTGSGNADLAFYTRTATTDTAPNQRMKICASGDSYFTCAVFAKALGTNDLILNNLNYECANYVDGTRGSWLIQEGENDLFIINQISCKKYKFNLIEIK